MLLIFLDTEMTGLDPEKHRIIEIAYQVMDSRSGKIALTYETVVSQPFEVWGAADPESLKINGFTWEEVLQGKSEQVVASEIANDLNHLGLGQQEGVFICQNPSLDRSFFIRLINPDVQESYGWPYHWLDLASMYWALRLTEQKPIQKEHELSKNEIAAHYHVPPEASPHRAMNGVKHLIACYEAIFSSSSTPLV